MQKEPNVPAGNNDKGGDQNRADCMAYLSEFENYLRNRRYSENTIKVYHALLVQFFNYFRLSPQEIIPWHIEEYNTRFILRNGYSASYQNQYINAIKLFYSKVLYRKMVIKDLERPKCPKRMPVVLSKDEVRKLIGVAGNIKHRAIISLIYSAGLRISEVINLTIRDIDSSRMVIHIRSGKGNKDRMVNLSPRLLDLLRTYYKAKKPSHYLFEGLDGGRYSTRSIGKFFKKYLQLAGIRKPATVHTLRHSYATHLVESGTDIHIIQRLLGHTNVKTTEIYLHISQECISEVRSPFDDL